MPQYRKDYNRERILETAASVFQEKGYSNTSMRDIATLSGIGLANIYNYFKNKDELFCTIVSPAIEAYNIILNLHHGVSGPDITAVRGDDYIQKTIDELLGLLKNYRSLLSLLFFKAQGSSLQNFREQFTDKNTETTLNYLSRMRTLYPDIVSDISPFSIHLHSVGMYSLMEEVVMHKIEGKELKTIIEEYVIYEQKGWEELILKK